MKGLLSAIRFLTIIPIGEKGIKEEELAQSIPFFPLVGLMIGGLLVAVKYLASRFFSPDITSLLVVGFWAALTGFLHLDGFCDTVDGICGGRNKEEVMRIMEEPNIGAKGAVALVFLILLKTFSVGGASTFGLLIAPMIGRWAIVAASATSSYPKSCGLGKIFIERCKKKEVLLATLIMIVIGIVLFGLKFSCLLGVALTIILPFVLYIKKKIGGMTGDTLGALSEVVEVATLLSIGFISC
jgi:adenosylcobinamide-GDP ribazoletransferase